MSNELLNFYNTQIKNLNGFIDDLNNKIKPLVDERTKCYEKIEQANTEIAKIEIADIKTKSLDEQVKYFIKSENPHTEPRFRYDEAQRFFLDNFNAGFCGFFPNYQRKFYINAHGEDFIYNIIFIVKNIDILFDNIDSGKDNELRHSIILHASSSYFNTCVIAKCDKIYKLLNVEYNDEYDVVKESNSLFNLFMYISDEKKLKNKLELKDF
jgi:hypothetical protein